MKRLSVGLLLLLLVICFCVSPASAQNAPKNASWTGFLPTDPVDYNQAGNWLDLDAGAPPELPPDATSSVFFSVEAGQAFRDPFGNVLVGLRSSDLGARMMSVQAMSFRFIDGGHLFVGQLAEQGQGSLAIHNEGRLVLDQASLDVRDSVFVGQIPGGPPSPGALVVNPGASLRVGGDIQLFDTGQSLLQLAGGSMRAGIIDTGGQPMQFQWAGGELSFNQFFGDLVNPNGVLRPGDFATGISTGVATINGNFDQQGEGTMAIEIGGTVLGETYDHVNVMGNLAANGTLLVSLLPKFEPSAGNEFDVLNFMTLSGQFSNVVLPDLAPGLEWDLADLHSQGILRVQMGMIPVTSSMWTGATGDGDYFNPQNWDNGVVPANNPSGAFAITIPSGASVLVSGDQPVSVTEFDLAAGGSFALAPGAGFMISDAAIVSGTIAVTGPNASFSAENAMTTLTGAPQLLANSGGSIVLPADRYDVTVDPGSTTLLAASGPGSLLDLSELNEFTSGFRTNSVLTLAATNGGILDLSSLTSISGMTAGEGRLVVRAANGGILNLASLAQMQGRTKLEVASAILSLPALNTAENMDVEVAGASLLSMPALASYDSATLTIQAGGTVNAPTLSAFTRSTLSLGPGQNLLAPQITNIDGSRISVRDGATFAVAAPSYSLSRDWGDTTILSAAGASSSLDLSALQTFAVGLQTNSLFTISAINGGSVDLSQLTSLSGVTDGTGRLILQAQNGGALHLGALAQIQERTRVDLDNALLTLPVLLTATEMDVDVDAASALNLSSLQSYDMGNLTVQNGGTVNAPQLTSFTRSTLELNPAREVNAPQFTQFDGSRIFVREGSTLTTAAASYTLTRDWGTAPIFVADGAGSQLDFTSVEELAVGVNTNSIFFMTASNGGMIDLSSLTNLAGVSNGLGRLVVGAGSGGTVRLGSPDISAQTNLQFDGTDAILEFGGNARLRDTTRFTLTNSAELELGGDFHFEQTNASSFNADQGMFRLHGQVPQMLEVGGEDMGSFGQGAPTSGNFGIGRLFIGDANQPANVELMDVNNNGGGNTPEALYIFGIGGANGLQIAANSSLKMNGTNVYTNGLASAGQLVLEGTIATTEPFVNDGMVTGNGVVNGMVINNGVFSPGGSPGEIVVEGSMQASASSLFDIEVAGEIPVTQHDRIRITNTMTLGGELRVTLIDGGMGIFEPNKGDEFEIFTASGGITGQFASVKLPNLPSPLGWLLSYQPTIVSLGVTPRLAGDFDADGDVDRIDYGIWEQNAGTLLGASQTDGDSDGDMDVDADDLLNWLVNFGASPSATRPAASLAVPEPGVFRLVLMFILFAGANAYARKRIAARSSKSL